MRRIATLVVLLMVTASAIRAAEPIVTTDLLRIRSVSSIDVTRDGSRAVFVVRSIATIQPERPTDAAPQSPATPVAGRPGATTAPDWSATQPTYKYQSHLFLLDLSTLNAVPRQITFGDRRDGSPRFSPDGKRIAFMREKEAVAGARPAPQSRAAREDEHTSQIWILPVDGGEARQLTDFPRGCDSPVWSPDGRRILVAGNVPLDELEGVPPWPMERPKRTWKDAPLPAGIQPRPDGTREQIRAWLERNAEQLNPNVIDRLEFQGEQDLRGLMRFQHLYVIEPEAPSASASPITPQAARRITNGFFDHAEPAFMPDGQSVVYVSKKPIDLHLDRVLPTSLWRVNIDGGNDHQLLNLDGWTLNSPKPSRDGSVVAFTATKLDEPAFRQTQLGFASIKGKTASDPVWLTDEATFLGSVNDFEWMQTQPALVFNTAMRGGFPLMTVSPGTIQPATLVGESDGKTAGVNVFGIGGGAMVYSVTCVANPCVLKVRDARGERTVYDLNPWVNAKTLSSPVEATLTRPDGTKIQYWLMEPTNREPGRRYPLVLEMHGGPATMWGPGEFTTWHEFQLLCSWGFGVVYSNPRGSGGYGYEFQKKNFQDWGEGPGGDVLATVDEAVLKDWVDRERLVITGGSYAGYLTVWVVAHDNRFKAAVAQRGVYDFNAFFGEGNAWRLVGWAMGGAPYDPRFKQAIERNNIWTHVQRIKTPLLIKHGDNDLRTGVSQSQMLYRALKDMNKPVEYVRYPNVGHELSRSGDPMQRMDRLDRIIEFFERYVENPRPAPVASGS